jgi:hypothetical protein
MSISKPQLKWNIETVVMKKFRVYDTFGATGFELRDGTWSLRKLSDGSTVLSGSYEYNNTDTDSAGNSIITLRITIDLRKTDPHELGSYYLIIETSLDTQQTDIHRVPVELIDLRTKGIE